MVDVGTTEVEADMENTSGDLAGTEMADENNSSETESAQEETTLEEESQQPEEEGITGQAGENETTDAAAGAVEAPVLSFSEETQMEWPVNGNILLDYNMDQTVYFPTLDQYKLSPAISVQAAEGASGAGFCAWNSIFNRAKCTDRNNCDNGNRKRLSGCLRAAERPCRRRRRNSRERHCNRLYCSSYQVLQ